MVISVYVLQSLKDGYYYVGMTNNIQRRFEEHQNKKVQSTKSRTPFLLVYTKQFDSRHSAREHEKYLKTAAGKKFLVKFLSMQQPSNLPD